MSEEQLNMDPAQHLDDDLFTPDFSQATNLAPEGRYPLMVFGAPHACISRGEKTKGQVYLTWNLKHMGDNERYGSIFERTMLKGPGAGRLRMLLRAMGLTKEQCEKFRPVLRSPITDAKKGSPCDILVEGQPWDPTGRELDALIVVEEPKAGSDYDAQNRIKKFF